jgi:hypothetical protein
VIPAHIEHTFRALDRIERPSAGTANKSLSHGQKDATAGLGSVEAGPIVRYWTVKFRHTGSAIWNYTAVIACDPFKASMVMSKLKPSISETEVVREINHEEFLHLTRSSP